MTEQWVEFAPDYEVSSYGRVRSWKRQGKGNKKREIPKYFTCKPCKNYRAPYVRVQLRINDQDVWENVHVLVMRVFGSVSPDNTCIVLHNDGDPSNNKIENLRWGTYKENAKDRDKHGRTPRGIECVRSKLINEQVLKIRKMHKTGFWNYADLGRLFNVDQSQIRNIVLRKQWRHL